MANMTAQDVIDRVRIILNDQASSDFRWLDEELLPLVNLAVTQVTNMRPDSLYSPTGSLLTITPVTDVNATVSIDDRWLLHVALFASMLGLDKQAGQSFNVKKNTALGVQFANLMKV